MTLHTAFYIGTYLVNSHKKKQVYLNNVAQDWWSINYRSVHFGIIYNDR